MLLDLQGYESTILSGAWVTLQVALLSLFVAVVLGMLGALAKLSSITFLRWWATLYTTVIRGIPDLILMMLIFFGGQIFINEFNVTINDWLNEYFQGQDAAHEWVSYLPDYVDVSPFFAGVATIGFIFGAYMAETFRGAIIAVDKGQLEAARAYGMSSWMVFRRVMFPQMMRHALPGFGNNWLVLLKTTALVSIIGLEDMVKAAGDAGGSTQMPFTFYFVVALVFLVFTAISTSLLSHAEKKYAIVSR